MALEVVGIKGYLSAVATKYRNGQKYVKVCADHVPNLLTTAGKDKIHALLYVNVATSGYAHGFGYIAATESVITPAVANTTLTGEITDRGMPRTDAGTKTYTSGSSQTLIEHTFTVSGAGFTSVLASALFDAASVGTMAHIANFATGTGALVAGDTLKISWTMNAS
jgi:hypothetical protein